MNKNLDKENFWNDLQRLLPDQVKAFCDWIDDYKKKVEWNSSFITYEGYPIKFHNLPYEMQIGVMKKFFAEKLNKEVDLSLNVEIAYVQIGKLFYELSLKS